MPLTPNERRDLELAHDGTIPPQAIADKIAARGRVYAYVPTAEDLARRITFAKQQVRFYQTQVDGYTAQIADRIAGMEMMADGSVKDQHRRHIAYLQRQLESVVDAQKPWLDVQFEAEQHLAELGGAT